MDRIEHGCTHSSSIGFGSWGRRLNDGSRFLHGRWGGRRWRSRLHLGLRFGHRLWLCYRCDHGRRHGFYFGRLRRGWHGNRSSDGCGLGRRLWCRTTRHNILPLAVDRETIALGNPSACLFRLSEHCGDFRGIAAAPERSRRAGPVALRIPLHRDVIAGGGEVSLHRRWHLCHRSGANAKNEGKRTAAKKSRQQR